jgi:hypothetical protein
MQSGEAANLLDIDWVRQHGEAARRELQLTGEVGGHGLRLADHAAGATIQEAIEEAGVAGQIAKGKGGGDGSVLAHKETSTARNQGTQEKQQEVEVKDAGEDEIGFEAANETEQGKRGGADSGRAESVHLQAWGQRDRAGFGLCDESEMEFVLVLGERSSQKFDDAFRAAAAEMRNEQQKAKRSRRGHVENLVAWSKYSGKLVHYLQLMSTFPKDIFFLTD